METLRKRATSVAHLNFVCKFHRRCLSTSFISWCKKVKNDQKFKSMGPALFQKPISAKIIDNYLRSQCSRPPCKTVLQPVQIRRALHKNQKTIFVCFTTTCKSFTVEAVLQANNFVIYMYDQRWVLPSHILKRKQKIKIPSTVFQTQDSSSRFKNNNWRSQIKINPSADTVFLHIFGFSEILSEISYYFSRH